VAHPVRRNTVEQAQASVDSFAPVRGDTRIRATADGHLPTRRRLAFEELEFDDISHSLDENVPQIRVPSVIIGALGDQLVAIDNVRRLADTLPAAELISVDGDHMIAYTHPDLVGA
jgi:pimeloyl-ACP methyl ester carboxylesterase